MIRHALIISLLYTPVFIFNGWLSIRLYHWNNKRKDKRFLRHLHIWFPDAATIDLVALESTDEEAIHKIKEQVRERQRAREAR